MADDATAGATYRMVFNVACHNTDDHLRNHGFLWDEEGWRLASVYDIVPQLVSEPNQPGRLALGVGPVGPLATYGNALAGCQHFGITRNEAGETIMRVRAGWATGRKSFGLCKSRPRISQNCAEPSGLRRNTSHAEG